ncbi:hypothetical protein [Micromonospora sp. DT31]|uniref:hypothetical protein n=1 Tax=Micromonospora sp. DT31 TaxID=3393434 RepID=UPI003CF54A76
MTVGDEQPPSRMADGDEPRPAADAADAGPPPVGAADAPVPAPADAPVPAPVPAPADTVGRTPAAPADDAAPHPPGPAPAVGADLVSDAVTTVIRPVPGLPVGVAGQEAAAGRPGTATKRRRWPLWTVLGLALALGLALGLVAGAVPGVVLRGLAPDAAGRSAADRDDAGTAVQRQLGERMIARLDGQAAALLGGDRARFLAVAEPAARPALTRRYAALRALRVTVWRPAADGVPAAVDGVPGEWRLTVTVGYCFVVPDCAPSTTQWGTRWRMAGEEPRLTGLEPSRTDPAGARPWEVSDLAVAVGARAVVATTPAHRGRLPGLLAQAEAAARSADRYAVGGSPPARYLVYFAGKAEWQRWYGGGRPKWTAGYAVGVGGGRHDVVLNAQSVTPAGVDDLLRHELTHAAALPDRGYADRASWWLVEGLAEYAGADGQPVDRYEGVTEVRDLLRGGWSGRLDAVAPADDASGGRVGGAYGVGYLAVRHLVDRYGEQRMLDFYRAVVHDRRSPEQAADEVFGDPWSVLHDDCVAYVRAAVG